MTNPILMSVDEFNATLNTLTTNEQVANFVRGFNVSAPDTTDVSTSVYLVPKLRFGMQMIFRQYNSGQGFTSNML